MLQAEQILYERYQLKQQLGNNAGRQTWLAVDLSTQTKERVIVKLLPFSPQIHWDDLKLFEREAQVLKYLNHPYIPNYRDYFSTEPSNSSELPWFGLVQDYIPGYSLQQLLKKGKHFTEAQAKQIAIHLLNILIYLHELSPSVLHRDIKPSNIIWGKNRQVYLVDFGAVQERAQAEGATFTVVGTGGYAPPEQLWGRAVPASDLYALGVTLIHLLTGTAPVDLPKREMRLQFRDRVSLSPSFAHWIEMLIAPAPELRFSNARKALLALQANNSPSSLLEIANIGSQETTPKGRKSAISIVFQFMFLVNIAIGLPIITIFSLILLLWRGDLEPLPQEETLFGTVWKDYQAQAEGKNNIGAINRAQQAYFLEWEEFTESLADLGVGIKPQTTDYDYEYSIRATPLAVFSYASPAHYRRPVPFWPKYRLERNLKAYVGAVFLTTGEAGEILTGAIACEAKSPGMPPDAPRVQGNTVECGSNTKQLGGSGSIAIGKDSALAYSAVNDATTGQYDQALEKVQTIKNNFFRARALAAIAGELAENGYYDRALNVTEPLKDDSAKAWALKVIAIKLAKKGQYDKALEVAQTIKDDSSKQMALDAIAHVRH